MLAALPALSPTELPENEANERFSMKAAKSWVLINIVKKRCDGLSCFRINSERKLMLILTTNITDIYTDLQMQKVKAKHQCMV